MFCTFNFQVENHDMKKCIHYLTFSGLNDFSRIRYRKYHLTFSMWVGYLAGVHGRRFINNYSDQWAISRKSTLNLNSPHSFLLFNNNDPHFCLSETLLSLARPHRLHQRYYIRSILGDIPHALYSWITVEVLQ